MPKGPFGSQQFTATQWSTADDKAQFGNQLLRFTDEGFPQSLFTKTLYNRLSQCFQHIAHHDLHGFYGTWFAAPGDQARFLDHFFGLPASVTSHIPTPMWNDTFRSRYDAATTWRSIIWPRSKLNDPRR